MVSPDRLVEVWAADVTGYGKCGSGWLLSHQGVLTARSVVEPFLRANQASGKNRRLPDAPACQVRLTTSVAAVEWVDFDVIWSDAALDIALLQECEEGSTTWAGRQLSALRL